MRHSTCHQTSTAGDRNAVEAFGLAAVYGRAAVLRDIDVAIAEGESIAVMGPNGAGKSTLLKCFVGLVRPASGRVCWFGTATTRSDHVCRQIGYVGQESGLYPELTVWENLLFSGRMYGVSNIRERAATLLAEAGIESQAHRPAGQLSQGMRQRLAIARGNRARAAAHCARRAVVESGCVGSSVAGVAVCTLAKRWPDRLLRQSRRCTVPLLS